MSRYKWIASVSNPDQSVSNTTASVAFDALPLRQALFQNQDAYGIIVSSIDGTICDWNLAAERIYGYSREEALGKSVMEILCSAELPALHDTIVDAIGRNGHWSGQIDFRRKDGQEGVSDTVIFVFRDEDGQLGRIGINRDITEHKRIEADAHAARDEAELANRAKSNFLANMSHELRTPLNAINGFSEMIFAEALGPLGNVEYQKYASYIREAGIHLLQLINDLLDISKIESGSVVLVEEAIDVAALMRSCVAMIRERADAADVNIYVDIDEELLPLLRGDPTRIKQIILNLMSNAVKFTPAGGTVTIRAWYHVDRGFVLQVADTGIGIAAHNIPKALARFEQIESTLDRTYEGTGLGLPLTKSLVEQHGGSLDLHSEIDVGTVVTVSLPVSRAILPAA